MMMRGYKKMKRSCGLRNGLDNCSSILNLENCIKASQIKCRFFVQPSTLRAASLSTGPAVIVAIYFKSNRLKLKLDQVNRYGRREEDAECRRALAYRAYPKERAFLFPKPALRNSDLTLSSRIHSNEHIILLQTRRICINKYHILHFVSELYI